MENVKQTKVERCYDGFLKIDKYFFIQQRLDGSWTEEFTREVVLRKNAVAILIHDPKNDLLLFTRQFRPGAYANGAKDPWIYEMVAGLIDVEKGEDIQSTIQKEVEEEAKITTIDNLELISSYFPSCGSNTEKVFLYYATADLTNVDKWGRQADEDEIIEIKLLTTNEAFDYQNKGLIGTANGQVALNWLKLKIAGFL